MTTTARSLPTAALAVAAAVVTLLLTVGHASAANGLPSDRSFDYDCGTSRAAILHLHTVGNGEAIISWRDAHRTDTAHVPGNTDIVAPNRSGTVNIHLSPNLRPDGTQTFIAFDNSTGVGCDVRP